MIHVDFRSKKELGRRWRRIYCIILQMKSIPITMTARASADPKVQGYYLKKEVC